MGMFQKLLLIKDQSEWTEEHKIAQGMKASIIEGIGAVVFLIVTQGVYFTKIALSFGADEFTLGLLGSIQFLSMTFQLIVPRVVERLSRRKQFTLILSVVSRLIWSLFLIFPLIGIMNTELFIATVSISFISGSMANNAWTSWMRDLVPREKMGKFYGRRNLILSFVSMMTVLLYSNILDQMPGETGIRIILVLSLSGAAFAGFFLSRQYEPPLKESSSWSEIRAAIQNKNFQKLLTFAFFWNFTLLVSAPFFSFHMIENLQLPFTLMGYLAILSSIVSMIFYIIWGKLSDRIGHKNILRVGIGLASCLALLWFFMTPETMAVLLWTDSIITGVAWSAINLAIFTVPLLVAGKSSGVYLSLFAALSGLGGFSGSLIGGILAKQLSEYRFFLGQMPMYGIQILFLLGFGMRISALLLLNRVEVTGHVRLRSFVLNGFLLLSRKTTLEHFDNLNRAKFVEPPSDNP